MKLVIGAGERRVDGFLHHDVQKLPGIDIVCEFWNLPDKIPPESCEEIHMTHVLEHFPMQEALAVLLTIWTLLKSGGKFYIEVPNFKWHAQKILENPRNRTIVEYAFGGQLNEWDFHYNGFTPEILTDDLTQVGFVIEDIKPESSISLWAVKWPNHAFANSVRTSMKGTNHASKNLFSFNS